MKKSLFSVVILLLTGPARADELPFFATPDTPDYIAKIVELRPNVKPSEVFRTVAHHSGWMHVEERSQDQFFFTYGNFFKHLLLRGSRDKADGDITWMDLSQVQPSHDYFGIRGVVESNDHEIVGNEHCRWREIIRRDPKERSYGPYWHTCLTEDGIEVATKVLSNFQKEPMSEEKASELKRQPVKQTDVAPPAQVFSAEYWLKPLRTYPETPADEVDFEAHLKGDRSEVVLLRHYPWWARVRRGNDGSFEFRVWNPLEDQGVYYLTSKSDRQLHAYRSPFDPKHPIQHLDLRTGKVNLMRIEHLLGEECTWFNLMPNVSDAGHSQCQTKDGIPLKDVYTSGWGSGEAFETVSFKRRAVSMHEMLPPEEALGQASWGFPRAK